MSYHIMQMKAYKTTISKFNQFRNNYSHYLLRKLRSYQKGVPRTAQISKLESIFSKFPSQQESGGNTLFWGTAREMFLGS